VLLSSPYHNPSLDSRTFWIRRIIATDGDDFQLPSRMLYAHIGAYIINDHCGGRIVDVAEP
jgi:hypothetical protein